MDLFPAPPPETHTLELLDRIRDGSGDAWTELYRTYHDELLFVARMNLGRRLRAALESEDVLQSVALEAFQALPGFVPRGRGSLRRFLHRLVLNKIRDRADTFGAKKRSGAVPLTDSLLVRLPGGETPPAYHDRDRFERLERQLGRLPDDMRDVLLLRKVDGLSSQEVARRMDRTDAAVRKLYSRALARLAVMMDEGEGEGKPS